MQNRYEFDYLIIGSGAAGLFAASKLAEHGKVAVVNKGEFSESNTWYAQGGIAGVMDATDSVEHHVSDTLQAGCGLCHEDAVRNIIGRGNRIIEELISFGTAFDSDNGVLHLTREAAHSHRRIAHAKDATGKAVGEALLAPVARNPNIKAFPRHMAVDVITARHLGRYMQGPDRCFGAYVLAPDGEVITIAAKHTILATGGAGKVYLFTSNPHVATGDGVAMAWRAGCPVMNMEFIQFHPTCLYNPLGSTELLTEALRGEGAYLTDAKSRRFMPEYHALAELAPRDIVARAIDYEMKKQGCDFMYLDARHLGSDKIEAHFPNIMQRLLKIGIDLRTQPVPIVPAAHYLCGGVQTDVAGKTPVDGLHVIGESACTGLHGANRLASNSLLECLVMAELCAELIAGDTTQRPPRLPEWDASGVVPATERVQIKQNWEEIRTTMSNYVGIVRSDERLRRARRRLAMIREEIASYYWQHPIGRDLIELRNLSLVAELIVRSAQQRRESRGLHFSTDHRDTLDKPHDTVLAPDLL
ncbi:MAG: L-aspartate oxidase [Zetaproteobacteria bacterium CG06_land_8_20_14_3_00_59_53]|nr:MAG: L-aspartate oxidase [Zetaproteobacteria bacterium CG2_30_59_37]PIO90354.1 MAG: L-aspartate oxidase [Zetaproteobacteria bacterium CG23_combo_of_CG06-09_8_20_14_all_59_86]PIQ65079.1 MAG: L-aspartate oxidase [Zetaproteobacteria bacterium CG11_big_fil_rev_8_21_14_0_20_59_439]PIU70168.1 MAG: L-aspartate oxidase [Zetaproteobacteria bacterium CG06_land_8_20_14_3_00_59_53]PIU96139.1 MAG: L-aspartate oxidase [Zetaproteobacteria bacterium CG03_land_8_20_14_0_80_59_51]PIY44927.1 MAG: L-aspartate 